MDMKKLARIIGHLQFDGSVTNSKNARTLFYYNSNKDLINEFIDDVKEVFCLKPSVKKDGKLYRVYFHNAEIVRALNKITRFHSYTWLVPDFVLNGSEEVKIAYLQAFFDDEGYVSRTHKGSRYIVVRGTSVNLTGLNSIKELLSSLNIDSNIRKFQSGKTSFSKYGFQYVLTITNFYNIKNFHNKIRLTSKNKQKFIDKFIYNHGKNVMREPHQIKEVLEMKSHGLGARKISKKLNIPKGTISHWLRGDRRRSK